MNFQSFLLPITGTRRALDLFCESGSVGAVLTRMGFDVVSVDQNLRCHSTLTRDILEWDDRVLLPDTFDLIAASPPCL